MNANISKIVPITLLAALTGFSVLSIGPARAASKKVPAKVPAKKSASKSASKSAPKAKIPTPTIAGGETPSTPVTTLLAEAAAQGTHTFTAEVWADNWFALYNGETKVGEDSVPITTERSFNAETFSFQARYPLQLRAISKDYTANDTGLEYIGTDRQQIGDGGFIVQITDTTTGKIVAATDATWRGLVIHAAPLNADCEKSPAPDKTCTSRIAEEPTGWRSAAFDDSNWPLATVYSEQAVGVKQGYLAIKWDPSAKLIWSRDLKIDNTILWRKTITS